MPLKHLAVLPAHKTIILASASPRRRELLQQIGLPVTVLPSNFEENLAHENFRSAQDYAVATSRHKAEEVASRVLAEHPHHHLIISADTVVECGGKVLEKPRDAEDAARMLTMLSGGKHFVHTGVTLIMPAAGSHQPFERCFAESTEVSFCPLSEDDIREYIASGEPMGKAGAYGIQGRAAAFVTSISGCYFNVVGFPIHAFCREVQQMFAGGLLPPEPETNS